MVGIISVVIGGHFGGGDHFDGGDHFGGGTMSPKCIGNSTVHYEALTMCFIKRTLLNLSINSREKR